MQEYASVHVHVHKTRYATRLRRLFSREIQSTAQISRRYSSPDRITRSRMYRMIHEDVGIDPGNNLERERNREPAESASAHVSRRGGEEPGGKRRSARTRDQLRDRNMIASIRAAAASDVAKAQNSAIARERVSAHKFFFPFLSLATTRSAKERTVESHR